MDDFLKPVKTTRNIKDKIQKFESLNSMEPQIKIGSTNSGSNPNTKPSIIEIKDKDEDDSTEQAPVKYPVRTPALVQDHTPAQLAATNPILTIQEKKHKRDSTAFRRLTYLPSPLPADSPIANTNTNIDKDTVPETKNVTVTVSGKSLADDAREILKSQPDQTDLLAVLEYLQYGIDKKHDFNIHVTGPQAAQILNILVTVIVPDIWPNLWERVSIEEHRIKKIVISCLTCLAGIGALLNYIRQSKSQSQGRLIHVISALNAVLKGNRTILGLLPTERLARQELISLLGGGRILSVTAGALAGVVDENTNAIVSNVRWLGDGKEYTRWLGRNITMLMLDTPVTHDMTWKWTANLLKRALSLGYKDVLIHEIYTSMLFGSKALWTPMHTLLRNLSDHDQKVVFDTILLDLSTRFFGSSSAPGFSTDNTARQSISAAAALIAGLVRDEMLQDHLEDWIVVSNASYASVGLASRRALIAVLGTSEDKLERILSRALTNFADKIQIQHASSLQQDAYAQTILLAMGYLKRLNPEGLRRPHISSLLMRSVSNRLGASIPRARLLGMIVGTAYSKAVDKPDQVLDFDVEEMQTEEVKQWLMIPDMQDKTAEAFDPAQLTALGPLRYEQPKPRKAPSKSISKSVPPKSQIISIEEVTDSDSEDDDLIPYAKPDSDPEDSDDDPTVIDRSRPSAPVYIVDLIKQLQMTDKPDVIDLALRAAPSLIRRKIGFGTELSDNLHSLATVLVNLQEGMSDSSLQQLRLESLIACVVAKPDDIAPSLAALYFEGDFSVHQRVVILTVMGLSSRELAGFKASDEGTMTVQEKAFPSKRLPSHIEPSNVKQLQAQAKNPIAALTLAEARSTIQPMALAAADKMTGPSVLKIRTFSSRMDVEKKTKEKQLARTKLVPKNLHSVLVRSFYLPLCCRMSLLLSSSSGIGNLNTMILSPSLTRMLLQTLTLVLHTLGPSASLHLPTLTQETLLLLMSLHTTSRLSTDPMVLPALLHLLLGLMNITIEAGYTAQEQLITIHGGQVAELVNWANQLGDKIAVPKLGEEVDLPWSVLAAGIQVKWYEMGQRFQGRMLGLVNAE